MQLYQENTTSAASLTREHWDVPIRVRLLPFVEFSRDLDRELEELVARYGTPQRRSVAAGGLQAGSHRMARPR
jgi:hypothetical protein